MPSSSPVRLRTLAPLLLLSLALAGCDSKPPAEEQAPKPAVSVETVREQPLAISTELSGRILAPRIAEVRARVAGVVLKRVYREGSDVKQGDVLFRITRHRSRPTTTAPAPTWPRPRPRAFRRACRTSATPS